MKQTMQSPKRFISVMMALMLFATFAAAVPASAADCTWTHRVRAGDTLSNIAKYYETTVSELLTINPQITSANLIVQGSDLCVSTTEVPPPLFGTIYQISIGDSLAVIAQKFGTTLSELARANGIGNVNLIFEGETITVPEVPVVVEPAS